MTDNRRRLLNIVGGSAGKTQPGTASSAAACSKPGFESTVRGLARASAAARCCSAAMRDSSSGATSSSMRISPAVKRRSGAAIRAPSRS